MKTKLWILYSISINLTHCSFNFIRFKLIELIKFQWRSFWSEVLRFYEQTFKDTFEWGFKLEIFGCILTKEATLPFPVHALHFDFGHSHGPSAQESIETISRPLKEHLLWDFSFLVLQFILTQRWNRAVEMVIYIFLLLRLMFQCSLSQCMMIGQFLLQALKRI